MTTPLDHPILKHLEWKISTGVLYVWAKRQISVVPKLCIRPKATKQKANIIFPLDFGPRTKNSFDVKQVQRLKIKQSHFEHASACPLNNSRMCHSLSFSGPSFGHLLINMSPLSAERNAATRARTKAEKKRWVKFPRLSRATMYGRRGSARKRSMHMRTE